MAIREFLDRYVPWGFSRLYYKASVKLSRLVRLVRFRRVPARGWGKGWRVLVFRCQPGLERQLHVLAPVNGDEFDWDLLRRHVGGEPWPEHSHEPGHQTGVLVWTGHHIYIITDEFGPERVPMEKLIPGEFRGGVDVGLTLIDVREANVQAA